jgi:hypothetical protein
MNEQQIRLKLSRLPGDKLIRVAIASKGIAEGIYTKEDAVQCPDRQNHHRPDNP